MTNINNIESALTTFENASIKHAEATEQGNYKIGNKCYASITTAVAFLKQHDEMQQLSQFLHHRSTGTRLWAASYLLPIHEMESVKVLEQIEQANGIHSLTARTTLREWQKGTLKL